MEGPMSDLSEAQRGHKSRLRSNCHPDRDLSRFLKEIDGRSDVRLARSKARMQVTTAHINHLSHFGEPRCLANSEVEGSRAEVEVKQPEVKFMSVVSMKQLLEAGVHFGHQTRRWNPKMAPYIFAERNGIYIIDLQQTVGLIDEAYDFMRQVGESEKPVLFVGTKKQAQAAIKDEAERCGMFYVNERWLGGMLTNHKTISKRIDRLNEIREMEADGTINKYAKKEALKLQAEADKLEKFLGGIKDMKGMPGALFVVDPKKEKIAVKEARILGIPVVGIVDTNCDPDDVDYIIPANDDAIRAVKLIAGTMADAIIEAKQGECFAPAAESDEAPEEAEEAAAEAEDEAEEAAEEAEEE